MLASFDQKRRGGIGELAKKTSLNRQNLYKLFSAKRQPKIETLGVILDGLGFRLSIIPKNPSVSVPCDFIA
ncbi:DNA-binding protein [Candidatus Finniella inopinata]|uniref:DNA-binding protein n=1 Tax=Candidatus Finniella inopinata TaxID=1696036 RepID=UPI003B969433